MIGDPTPAQPLAGGPPPLLLVTGAAGRVGRELVPRLGSRYRLRLTDLPSAALDRLAQHGEVRAADLRDPAALRDVFAGVDAVLHLAGTGRRASSWERLREANVLGTYCAVTAALHSGCRRFIYASSVHAVDGYGADLEPLPAGLPPLPRDGYGLTKAFGELLAEAALAPAGCAVVVLRLGAVAGAAPGQDVSRVRADLDDVAASVADAVSWPGPGTLVINAVSDDARLARTNSSSGRA